MRNIRVLYTVGSMVFVVGAGGRSARAPVELETSPRAEVERCGGVERAARAIMIGGIGGGVQKTSCP